MYVRMYIHTYIRIKLYKTVIQQSRDHTNFAKLSSVGIETYRLSVQRGNNTDDAIFWVN